MHLAEKIGELSLIPRNPDDEESVVWSEITLADLLDSGDKNSRKAEQGRDDDDDLDDDSSGAGLLSAIRNAIPEPEKDPPFRMEIVEAEEVREMLFDAETGKPLRDVFEDETAGGRPSLRSGQSAQDMVDFGGGGPADGVSPVSEDDFPIDFGE